MGNDHYDVLVVGAGLAGCFAALEAKRSGAKVMLVDKETGPQDRPFRESLILRDLRHLGVDLQSGTSQVDTMVCIVDDKLFLENSLSNLTSVYLKGSKLIEHLRAEITKQEIPLAQFEVTRLLKSDGGYHGIEDSTGNRLYAKETILCTGMNTRGLFDLPETSTWPPTAPNHFRSKIKVSTKVCLPPTFIAQQFQRRAFTFFRKNQFGYITMIPFDDYIECEGQLADRSGAEAVAELKAFLTTNRIARIFLRKTDIETLRFNILSYGRFGVVQPTAFNGLRIAGDAMNLHGPVHLSSLYGSIYTGRLAGALCGRQQVSGDHFEKRWMEALSELKNDFEILKEAPDQISATLQSFNFAVEQMDNYFHEISLQ